MSVEVVPGGQRGIDRVLDPGFTDRVDQLGLPERRARREEAEAEEADVSYLRRLLQAVSTSSGPSWCAARPVATRTSAGCWPGSRRS
jgi:hypothetical protein